MSSNSCENEITISLKDLLSKISFLKHINKLVSCFFTDQTQYNELVSYTSMFEQQGLEEERTYVFQKYYFQVRESCRKASSVHIFRQLLFSFFLFVPIPSLSNMAYLS